MSRNENYLNVFGYIEGRNREISAKEVCTAI